MTARTHGTWTDADGVSHSWEQPQLPLDVLRLHPDTWRHAVVVGTDRHHLARTTAAPDRNAPEQDPGRSFAQDVLGAVAECAVAAQLGGFWPALNRPDGSGDVWLPFVGPGEVRSTLKPDGSLIVRDRDDGKLDRPFVLVVGPMHWDGRLATVRCAGWIFGRDAADTRFRSAPGGGQAAYFVPQEALLPLEQLQRWTEGKGS